MMPEESHGFVTKEEHIRHEKRLDYHQKELKDISTAMMQIVTTQKEMQTKFTDAFGLVRDDLQRLFDKRSEDAQLAKPNFAAWIIGGITSIALIMSGLLTFVSIMIDPMVKTDTVLERKVEKLEDIILMTDRDYRKLLGDLGAHQGMSVTNFANIEFRTSKVEEELLELIKK